MPSVLSAPQLASYLKRINYSDASVKPNLETLRALQVAQSKTIPFENLSLHHPKCKARKETINTDIPSVFHKLVEQQRGGYCFEANALLAAALRAIGFDLYTSAARVVSPHQSNPDGLKLTAIGHQVVLVTLDGELWLADVGFGGQGLVDLLQISPFPSSTEDAKISQSNERSTPGYAHRLRVGLRESPHIPSDTEVNSNQHKLGFYVQATHGHGQWKDKYFFMLTEDTEDDFAVLNYTMAHSPTSPMQVIGPIAALHTKTGRSTYDGKTVKTFTGGTISDVKELKSQEDADAALKSFFGIEM